MRLLSRSGSLFRQSTYCRLAFKNHRQKPSWRDSQGHLPFVTSNCYQSPMTGSNRPPNRDWQTRSSSIISTARMQSQSSLHKCPCHTSSNCDREEDKVFILRLQVRVGTYVSIERSLGGSVRRSEHSSLFMRYMELTRLDPVPDLRVEIPMSIALFEPKLFRDSLARP